MHDVQRRSDSCEWSTLRSLAVGLSAMIVGSAAILSHAGQPLAGQPTQPPASSSGLVDSIKNHGRSEPAASPAYMPDVKTVAPPPVKEGIGRMPMEQVPLALPPKPDMPPVAGEDRLLQTLQTTVLMSQPGDSSIWARGLNYKASFSTDGFTYIPFLGADLSRNYPIHFTIAGISMGGNALDFAASAAPVVEGHVVTFNRGPVIETYLLSPGSVEQTFTINAEVTGDLVIRLDVNGELPMAGYGDRVLFGGDQPMVQYTQAVAVDGVDLRRPLLTTVTDGQIHITLPESIAHAARGALVIDPVITTLTVEPGTVFRSADVAYDTSTNQYCVVYERTFSATDHDVYSELFTTAGGAVPVSSATIDFTGADWRNPRIANNNRVDQFLVVAEVGAAPARGIRGVTRAAGSNAISVQFDISEAGTSGDKHRPDVGGDPETAGNTYYLVVWQRDFSATDHDIHARVAHTSATNLGGTVLINNSSGTIDDRPAVSNSNWGQGLWMVAWERQLSAIDRDIYGAALNWFGTIVNTTFPIDTTSSDNTMPSVSSPTLFPRCYMVVYNEGASDLYARIMEGTTIVAQGNLSAIGGNPYNRLQRQPSVDTDGTKFTVAYTEQFDPTDYDIYIQSFCRNGALITRAEARRNLAYTPSDERNVGVCSRYAGSLSASSREAMAVWNTGGPGGTGDILGAVFTNPLACCPTDIAPPGGNNATDIDDLVAVITQWSGYCLTCNGDVTGDLVVNIDDLVMVITAWGPCP